MEERSRAGGPILRHEQSAPARVSAGDDALVAAISGHIARHYDAPDGVVLHTEDSAYVAIDIHVVLPKPHRPVYVLVTSGMSERPMKNGRSAELMLMLPPTWPAPGTPEFEDERGHWPYRLLEDLARLPHEFDTVLWTSHTVPNGDPPRPYAKGAGFTCALIAPPVIAPEGFETLEHDGREIELLAVWPLYSDEMQVKLDDGIDRLAELMDEAKLLEIVEVGRPSVVTSRRRGLFRRR
jgi:hypothetical protein